MVKKIGLWDILAWIVLAGILLWLILKVLGIINTTLLIKYAPYFGAVYLAGWAMNKLETATREVGELKKFKDATIKEIHSLKENCVRNHKKR